MRNAALSTLFLSLFTIEMIAAADHPPLAKAPFKEDEARQYQQQWAKHIGKQVVFTNSIGMRLQLIPPGEFTMGRTEQQFDQVIELARKRGMEPERAAV